MKLEGIEENVILLDSVSKRYSKCGVRIGALITNNKEVMSTALKFGQARLSPPELGQIAGRSIHRYARGIFQGGKQGVYRQEDFMVEALNRMPGVYCPLPKGAFYTVVRLPVDDSDRFAQWLLEDFKYQ